MLNAQRSRVNLVSALRVLRKLDRVAPSVNAVPTVVNLIDNII